MIQLNYGTISPQKVRMYLSSRGWDKTRSESKFDVFTHKQFEDAIVVPNNREYADYAYRIRDLVNDLSLIYKEDSSRIFAGMTISSATDIIEYHYEPMNGEVGLIPVQDFVRILNAGQDINLYGLRDALEYQPHYCNSNWKGKVNLDGIRVGPTIPGSYIIQFIYPGLIEGKTIQETLHGKIDMDYPLLRTLCDKIEASLNEVIDAAERNKSYLDDDLKISYNFVSAIMGLKFNDANVSVQRYKTINSEESSKSMDLSSPVFHNISKIEEKMRPQSLTEQRTIVGRLVHLTDTREQLNDGPIIMKIKYLDSETDKVLSATFKIEGELADIAYDASKKRDLVSITGTILGSPRNRRIEEITDFKVL